MIEVYIYDVMCMLCGKKKGGVLNEIMVFQFVIQQFEVICDCNNFDMVLVDDVIMGVVFLVGEQGFNIVCFVVMNVKYVEMIVGFQFNCFCVFGLEVVNVVVVKVMFGEVDFVIGGGVEVMLCVLMGFDGGVMMFDLEIGFDYYIVLQGVFVDLIVIKYGFFCDDVDVYVVESQKCVVCVWEEGCFKKMIVLVKDQLGLIIFDYDEYMCLGIDM